MYTANKNPFKKSPIKKSKACIFWRVVSLVTSSGTVHNVCVCVCVSDSKECRALNVALGWSNDEDGTCLWWQQQAVIVESHYFFWTDLWTRSLHSSLSPPCLTWSWLLWLFDYFSLFCFYFSYIILFYFSVFILETACFVMLWVK